MQNLKLGCENYVINRCGKTGRRTRKNRSSHRNKKFAVRVRCAGMDVHSLPRGKERTKKTRQDVPSWISLTVPLYKAGQGEKHKILKCIARRKANTSGRYEKQNVFPFLLWLIYYRGADGGGAPPLAAVSMEQPAFFPYTEIEEVARESLYFLLFKFLRGV